MDTADVLVESFDPGFLQGLDLGYERLSRRNPRLVYVSVTPYGQDGPDAFSPAADLTLQAAGGLLALQGDPDRPPLPVGFPQAGFHAAAQAAADAVIALYERERSGLGQHLDVSMQAAVVWTLMNATGYPPNVHGNPPGTCDTRATPRQLFPGFRVPAVWACADGYLVLTVTLPGLGGRTLQRIADWMEEAGALPAALQGRIWSNWIADVVGGGLAVTEAQALIDAVRAFFLGKRKCEIQQFALESGAIIGPIYTVADVRRDPQLEARGYWTEVGGRTHPGPFACLSRTPLQIASPAPRLGEQQSLLSTVRPCSRPIARSAGTRQRAFSGLKVADFAWVGVGPIIAKALADHGATVVHVESETHPDVLRLLPPFKDGRAGINRSQFMANFNSSKLGLALNLNTDEGRAVARRLVAWADVVVESFTPGTMAKWGLDYAGVAATRPDLVMLSTCLRGQTGPERAFTGFGGQGAALAGIHAITGWPDRPPCGPWGAYTDFINPRLGVAALAAALLHRARTGEGQHIDLAQSEGGVRFIEPLLLDYTVNGGVAAPSGTRSRDQCPHGVFACAGAERYVAIAVESTEQWRALVTALALDAFAGPEYDDIATRQDDEERIEAAIAAWCRSRDAFAAAALLKARGVPAAVALWPSDLYEDRQLAHRQFVVTLDHAEMGPTPYDGLVTRFSATPGQLRPAPCLGQHTEHVLRDLLGLRDDDIEGLVMAGALA